MKDEEIRKADVSTELELPIYDAIAAGFPTVDKGLVPVICIRGFTND